EDVGHGLSHVGRVVDDQHPDAIETSAVFEPHCGSCHVSPSPSLSTGLYPSATPEVWSKLTRTTRGAHAPGRGSQIGRVVNTGQIPQSEARIHVIGPISDDRAGLETAVHHSAVPHDVVHP